MEGYGLWIEMTSEKINFSGFFFLAFEWEWVGERVSWVRWREGARERDGESVR